MILLNTLITIYATMLVFTALFLERGKIWVKWIYYSITYRLKLRQIKKNLAALNENNRLLALVEWLDTDHWFKKYWFGKRVEKFILKEVDKFK